MRILATLAAAAALAACDDPTAPPARASAPGGPAGFSLSTAGAAPYEYQCAVSLAPDQVAANDSIRRSYALWLEKRVTSEGAGIVAGGLRVTTGPGFKNGVDTLPFATISEGQGYGMLLAAHMGDRKTFNGLWAYARAHRRASTGLMKWVINRHGVSPDSNAATDGDQDIAFALLVADKKWGGYWNDLNTQVNNIMTHMVDHNQYPNFLKPGTNPYATPGWTYAGYFAPAYYKAFGAYTGITGWGPVADRSYEVLANVDARTGSATTGLVPNRTEADGDPVPGIAQIFGWNAIRAPWRLAEDAAWNCDARATNRLNRMNAFFAPVGPLNIVSGYKMNGDTVGGEYTDQVAFIGPLTAAALVSGNTPYKTAMWNRTLELGKYKGYHSAPHQDTAYYAAELRLLGMLLASGNMEDPLGGKRRRRVDDFEAGTLSKWLTFVDGTGTTITPRVIHPAAVGYGMEIDYSIAQWGGVLTKPAQDWSGYRALEFWVRGSGSGNRVTLELEDADGELFQYRFFDDFTGWRFASIPLNTTGFPRRTDWQPVTVNNGLTLTNVKVLRIAFGPDGAQGTIAVDRMELIPYY